MILINKVIDTIQTTLRNNIVWLDEAYGRSQKLFKRIDGRDYNYPAVYVESGEYLSMMPDSNLGNYSFFEVHDPQKLSKVYGNSRDITVGFSLIFWYNQSNIQDSKEQIKSNILRVLEKELKLREGRVEIKEICENSASIYKGYNINEIDSQHLMYPFAGVRFDGEITIKELCC